VSLLLELQLEQYPLTLKVDPIARNLQADVSHGTTRAYATNHGRRQQSAFSYPLSESTLQKLARRELCTV
jgi:hypothetical protein